MELFSWKKSALAYDILCITVLHLRVSALSILDDDLKTNKRWEAAPTRYFVTVRNGLTQVRRKFDIAILIAKNSLPCSSTPEWIRSQIRELAKLAVPFMSMFFIAKKLSFVYCKPTHGTKHSGRNMHLVIVRDNSVLQVGFHICLYSFQGFPFNYNLPEKYVLLS